MKTDRQTETRIQTAKQRHKNRQANRDMKTDRQTETWIQTAKQRLEDRQANRDIKTDRQRHEDRPATRSTTTDRQLAAQQVDKKQTNKEEAESIQLAGLCWMSKTSVLSGESPEVRVASPGAHLCGFIFYRHLSISNIDKGIYPSLTVIV